MPTKFLNLDIDPTLSANSDYYIPSQKAIKTALDSKPDKSISLEGYGIEDAYTKTEVDEIVSESKGSKVIFRDWNK